MRSTDEFEGSSPYTVHRIDKETTGILIVAKNRKFAQLFTSLFRMRKIHKIKFVKDRPGHDLRYALNSNKIKNKLNSIGIYFCKYEKDGIRLSIEGSMLMKNPKKNVIKLNKKQFEEWMKGNDLEIKHPKEYVLLEYENMVVGCGKSNEENIRNFIPKSRRMHSPKDF